jgi:hypothetical protein
MALFRIVGLSSFNGDSWSGCNPRVLGKWIGRRNIKPLPMTSAGELWQGAPDSTYFGMPFLSHLSR